MMKFYFLVDPKTGKDVLCLCISSNHRINLYIVTHPKFVNKLITAQVDDLKSLSRGGKLKKPNMNSVDINRKN